MPDTTISANAVPLPDEDSLYSLARRYIDALRAAGHHPYVEENGRMGILLHACDPTPEGAAIIAAGRTDALGLDEEPFAALLTVPDRFALLARAIRDSEPDPIFMAITCHQSAFETFGDACRLTDEVAARNEGREVTEADQSEWNTKLAAEAAALDRFTATIPTTIAGARAAIAHRVKCGEGSIPDKSGEYLSRLLDWPVFQERKL